MIKILLISVLLASTRVICPTTLHTAAGSPAITTAMSVVTNTLTVAASGSFPTAGTVITWSRAPLGTIYTIAGSSIPTADQVITRAFAVGFSDQVATAAGVNGFIGGISLGPGATTAVSNILSA
jgi:hypothetical protein